MSAKRPTESDALKIRCQQWRVGSSPTSGILANQPLAIATARRGPTVLLAEACVRKASVTAAPIRTAVTLVHST
jgi:hypothetical protein